MVRTTQSYASWAEVARKGAGPPPMGRRHVLTEVLLGLATQLSLYSLSPFFR